VLDQSTGIEPFQRIIDAMNSDRAAQGLAGFANDFVRTTLTQVRPALLVQRSTKTAGPEPVA